MGIALTFLGLYLYDRTSDSGRAERKARVREMPTLLPVHERSYEGQPTYSESPAGMNGSPYPSYGGGAEAEKRREEANHSNPQQHRTDGAGWLPAGTKAADTWTTQDSRVPVT